MAPIDPEFYTYRDEPKPIDKPDYLGGVVAYIRLLAWIALLECLGVTIIYIISKF